VVVDHDHVAVVDTATGGIRQLTSGPGVDRDPTWSPDGSRIAFLWHRTRGVQLLTIHPDGSGLHALTPDHFSLFWPVWSPDSRSLLVVQGQGLSSLVLVRPGKPRHVLVSTGDPSHPSWSPDGRRIAFEGSGGIWVARSDGSAAHVIRSDDGTDGVLLHRPVWSPDGRWLLVVHQQHRSALALMSPTGQQLRLASPLFWFVGGADWARR
jgi:TolB protein